MDVSQPVDPPDTTLARAVSPRGEVLLRRRARDGAIELRVNGVFVMDSRETATERAIARLALRSLEDAGVRQPGSLRVLVGGLGLGYTLAELVADPAVGQVVVAEIEPVLVEWHRRGLVPTAVGLIDSPAVTVVPGDVRPLVAAQPPGSLDIIVLDVDNGPGFLVYDDNAAVYGREFLGACREALAAKGVLVVWSAAPAPRLEEALRDLFAAVSHQPLPVDLGRITGYDAYVATSALSPRGRAHEEPGCSDH